MDCGHSGLGPLGRRKQRCKVMQSDANMAWTEGCVFLAQDIPLSIALSSQSSSPSWKPFLPFREQKASGTGRCRLSFLHY